MLWPYLSEFAERAIEYTEQSGNLPDAVHGHYVDAGIVGRYVARHFDVPLIFTAHSLGKPKLKMLLEQGVSREEANSRFVIDHRIVQEQAVLDDCDLVITSTRQEATSQYSEYSIRDSLRFEVIAPGTQVDHFFPYNFRESPQKESFTQRLVRQRRLDSSQSTRDRLNKLLQRFLQAPHRPMILSICRPDKRNNLSALVELYGESEELQRIANLVIVAGHRNDIRALPEKERIVFTDLLMLMDRYDLYGKMALPKRHCSETDIPELLRMAAVSGGVFVNPAYFELFGLTSIRVGPAQVYHLLPPTMGGRSTS